jgi:apolipoprotein N-acyltransferase
MRSIPLRLWALSILSAVLQVLPFPIAGPTPLWRRLFCWFCLVPLLMALLGSDRSGRHLRPGQCALLAYLSGFFWYMGNCYWIYQTMHIYGEIPKIASVGILCLFSLYVALYHALFGAGVGWLRRNFANQTVLWVVPFVWVAVELARARVTGFPWDLLGYTQVDNLLLTRLAPWTGVMGLSFVVALVNVLWLWRPQRKSLRYAGVGIALAVMVCAAALTMRPMHVEEQADRAAILLQENLSVGAAATGPPETKTQMLEAFDQLSFHPTFSPLPAGEKPDMVAWPEAPAAFFDADPEFRQSMGALAAGMKTPVIVNSITIAGKNVNGHYDEYNSANFFLPDGSYAGRYDKMHLVPFGEYTPYKPIFFFAGQLLGDLPFVPGTTRRLFASGGHKYGVFICYESIFGDDIRKFADDGAEVLVNISDDGWYGDSSAPWEHMDMVRMRAEENRKWILRATNTGITAAIDPYGRITATMPRHVRGSLGVSFAYVDGTTFYARHGDWLAWICAVVTVGLLGFGTVRARRRMKLERLGTA